MLESLYNGLLNFFIAIVNLLFSPINSFIANNVPDFQDVVNVLTSFFANLNSNFLPWFKDSLLLPQWFISFICGYLVMKLIAPLVFNSIKVLLKYWEALV